MSYSAYRLVNRVSETRPRGALGSGVNDRVESEVGKCSRDHQAKLVSRGWCGSQLAGLDAEGNGLVVAGGHDNEMTVGTLQVLACDVDIHGSCQHMAARRAVDAR